MPSRAQQRLPLHQSLQQHAPGAASAMVALQIALHTAAGSMDAEKDLFVCDATAGAFQLELPNTIDAIVGKPYQVREVSGANAVTLNTPGSETIDGAATFVVSAGAFVECVLVEAADGTRNWRTTASTGTLPAGSVGTADLADNAVTNPKLADDAVDSAEIADGAVDPVHLASGYRILAANAALTLAAGDREIEVESTDAGTKAATMTVTHAGHLIHVHLHTRSSTGSYTLAARRGTTAGTVTLDASGEGVWIMCDGTNWQQVNLTGGSTWA